MSCCQPSRTEFLATKLTNFRQFLEASCVMSEEESRYLDKFNSVDSAMPYLLNAVLLRSSGKLDNAIDSLCKGKDLKPGVREKIQRYMTMFCDVLTS